MLAEEKKYPKTANTTLKPSRPVLRYHGGKWILAPWIISHFPSHRIYTEAFGGAASVLMRKQRAFSETYNDLDGEIYSLFKVLQSQDKAADLKAKLEMTPFARSEFDLSFETSDDEIEQARRTLVRSWMGFGSSGLCTYKKTGFRSGCKKCGAAPQHSWENYKQVLGLFTARLLGVTIDNSPAIKVLLQNDDPETLHYVGPPYVEKTRNNKWAGKCYKYEMSENDHCELAEVLRGLSGMVVLSGYDCELYNDLYGGWRRAEKNTFAEGAKKTREILWLSPSVLNKQLNLFDVIRSDDHEKKQIS